MILPTRKRETRESEGTTGRSYWRTTYSECVSSEISVVSMSSPEPFVDKSDVNAPVRGFLHSPDGSAPDCLILTHGAGSNAQSPLLVALADAFCGSGLMVLRCDLPFRQMRPQGPPRGSADQDQAGLRAAAAAIRRRTGGHIFLGGHSYGGRQASMLAAAEPDIADRLLLLSYPLHPPRRPDVLRTAHFSRIRTPALFAHGTRDQFGSIPELKAALGLIPAPTELLPIPSAGHELVTKRTAEQVVQQIVQGFRKFIADLTKSR